jgi:hypothetical protein
LLCGSLFQNPENLRPSEKRKTSKTGLNYSGKTSQKFITPGGFIECQQVTLNIMFK